MTAVPYHALSNSWNVSKLFGTCDGNVANREFKAVLTLYRIDFAPVRTEERWFLCDFICPRCNYVHSYSISPYIIQTLFWNMSLAASTNKSTALPQNKNDVHTGTRCPLLCPSTRSNSSAGTWKKGVFTLVPSKYGNRAPCPGDKCERRLWNLRYFL